MADDYQAIVSRIVRGSDLTEIQTIISLRPITSNSVGNPSFDPATIQEDADGTRVVVHERFPQLVKDFLEHKRRHGSPIEQAVYMDHDWDWKKQVARLIAKRPIVFMNGGDNTMMRSGQNIGAVASEWDRVGQHNESRRLNLAEYLSYDEIMLGSLLGVSGPSYFINDGDRFNQGTVKAPGTFESRGIIIGLVGARFERPDRMDSVYMEPCVSHPRQHPDLDRIFRDFFSPNRSPVAKKSGAPSRFDANMYKGRMRISADILLREANARAKESATSAYVVIVGLGLGVWAVDADQPQYFVECFAEALAELGDELGSLGTLDFTYINVPEATQQAVQAAAAGVGATAIFSKRKPAAKLYGEAAKQLLVLSYAWDGNSFPGNEYWLGALSASGDPAAACMSTISELHNPILNPGFLKRVYANGVELQQT